MAEAAKDADPAALKIALHELGKAMKELTDDLGRLADTIERGDKASALSQLAEMQDTMSFVGQTCFGVADRL